MPNSRVIVRGGGEMGSGVAWRLNRCGFHVLITEIERPTAIRRWVCFAEAVYEGHQAVEGVRAVRVLSLVDCHAIWHKRQIAVLVCPDAAQIPELGGDVLVDAILAKRNTGTLRDMAKRVIGLGPGFTAGNDVDCVVETNRGPRLGRCLWEGTAETNTGEPGLIGGETTKRLFRSPTSGALEPELSIGEMVTVDQVVARIGHREVRAKIDGIVRGMMRSGTQVSPGLKIGDVDPRGEFALCGRISEKALAIAGGVLEAILSDPPVPRGAEE